MQIAERKLAAQGRGALIISLPKWWCRAKNLGKGSWVILSLEDEDIRVSPKEITEETDDQQHCAQN
ncbi:MAG: hypothetical protein KAW00_04820 [Dehalococcoidia bacterium]|nr:hypothetical protein [Dehalococcoidia bacterium]